MVVASSILNAAFSPGSSNHSCGRYWPTAGFELNGEVFVFAMNMMDFGGGLFPFALYSEPSNSQCRKFSLSFTHRCRCNSRVHFAHDGSFALVPFLCFMSHRFRTIFIYPEQYLIVSCACSHSTSGVLERWASCHCPTTTPP